MNPLALFPLLIAASMAAPAGLHAATNPLVHPNVAYGAAPGFAYAGAPSVAYHAAPAVAYQAAPAVAYAQVQVPLTKTIHYENKPVVTGYQTTILKPSIATQAFATPVFAQPAVIAPAPVAVEAPATVVVSEERPIEAAPVAVQQPAPVQVIEEAQAVQADSSDTEVIENPEFRSAAIQTAQPIATVQAAGPAPALTYVASPGAYATYAQVPAAQAVVYQAEAPHFDQLVTKEKVLAPVRTHTQITPTYTQVQPEVTVRKVIHDVPVAQPVAYAHTQYVQQPALTYAAGPAAYAAGPAAFAAGPAAYAAGPVAYSAGPAAFAAGPAAYKIHY